MSNFTPLYYIVAYWFFSLLFHLCVASVIVHDLRFIANIYTIHLGLIDHLQVYKMS
jgi:hypothetical protein